MLCGPKFEEEGTFEAEFQDIKDLYTMDKSDDLRMTKLTSKVFTANTANKTVIKFDIDRTFRPLTLTISSACQLNWHVAFSVKRQWPAWNLASSLGQRLWLAGVWLARGGPKNWSVSVSSSDK